jgi:hypothetical protein
MTIYVLSDGDGRLKDGMTETQRRWSNVTVMDGMKVMDIVMETAMDGLLAQRNGDEWATVMSVAIATAIDSLLAPQRRWMDCRGRDGDGRYDGDGDGWLVGNAMAMDG